MQINVQKWTLTICGVACGAYAAFAAYRFNVALSTSWEGYVTAAIMATVTVGALCLPNIAASKWKQGAKGQGILWAASWFAIMVIVLANSAAFTASGRRATTVEADIAINAYNQARDQLARTKTELEARASESRWVRTHGCTTNLEADASQLFCDEVKRLRKLQAAAQSTFDMGRPVESRSEIQYKLLAGWIGLSEDTWSVVVPVVTQIVLELAALVFMLGAGASSVPSRPVVAEVASPPRLRVVSRERDDAAPIPDAKIAKAMEQARDRMLKMMK